MNRILGTAAVAVAALAPAALAAPAAAPAAHVATPVATEAAEAGAHAAGPRMAVLPASGLVVRPLVDRDGRNAGRVNAVVIDTANGAVEYVLIGGRGGFNLNGELIALPWSMLQPPTLKDPIRLTITLARLANAPRIARDVLFRLNEARWRSRDYGFFGSPYPFDAKAGDAKAGNANAGNATAKPATAAAAPAAQPALLRHLAPGVGILVMQNGGLAALVEQRQAASLPPAAAAPARPAAAAPARPAAAAPHRPPMAAIPTSTEVFTRNGVALGHIVQIMVDTRSGRVAFAQIGKSGVLGVPPVVYPLPIEALRWSGNRAGFQLVDSPKLLARVPATTLARTRLALAISERKLALLYRDFGVPPFWTEPAGSPALAAAGNAPPAAAGAPPVRKPVVAARP